MFVVSVSVRFSLHWSCFFFKQMTAYEMRIRDWSSDVCSSDRLSWRSVSDSKLLCVEKIADRGGRRLRVFLHETMTADLHADVQPRQQLSRPAGSRSEERRVGKECVHTCRSRLRTYH